jgi:signal transduction histidine kinase
LSSKYPPRLLANRATVIALVAIYCLILAVVIRTLLRVEIQPLLPVYLALEFLFAILFTLMLWRPIRWLAGEHFYFVFQSLLGLTLYLLFPKFDFVLVLFNPLSFQAALVFPGRTRWLWAAAWALLTGLPLVIALGAFGLAVSLLPITICFLFTAHVSINQEIEARLQASQALVEELQTANRQLTAYANQVEELSSLKEHDRVASELHNSVNQAIQNILHQSRAARRLLERDPEHLSVELEQLQSSTQNCLEQMRGLIASLRPPEDALA